MALTVHGRVAGARQRLRAAGIGDAEAELDARLLAQHVLAWDAARYFSSMGDKASADFQQRYESLVSRRADREPLAYIVGHREFWGLKFHTSPSVLIPRPETELIIEAALELLPDRSAPLSIADVCTGSGCLAVALAVEYPRARVVAIDLSAGALEVARQNAEWHGAGGRVTTLQADLFRGTQGHFDLVVSNPPYVCEREQERLQPEVRDYEPALALFAGSDGLAIIRRVVPDTREQLRPGGLLILEFGVGQADAVVELISGTPGIRMKALKNDLQGIPRAAVAERAQSPA